MDSTRLKVIEIFNAQGTTKALAEKYCCKTSVIARIKGGIYPFDRVIADYKRKNLTKLITRGFGYDKDFKVHDDFCLY